jgi:flagellar hook-associated protein 1 FlgK
MASLTSALSIAMQALQAADGGLQVTNNNISNANTPGYTRQQVVLQETTPADNGDFVAGEGVTFVGYQSVRDELVMAQIQSQTSAQSGANASLASLQQIQPTFTTSTTDIGTEMSALFSSLSSLATDPTSSASRQAVLTAGQNLATAFNTASSTLTSQQATLNTQVSQDVTQINQLTQQIAALNPEIVEQNANNTVENGGALQDQQNQLIQQLSALTNVAITQTNNGVTISTGNGTALVVGPQSFALQTSAGTNGAEAVLDSNGNDITSTFTSGDLGGTIQTRDQAIGGLLTQLNTLANQFATAFNSVQASGYDQNGNPGQNFFTIPSTVSGSAAGIQMNITDPALLAASSDGTAGSDGNLANFAAVQTNALPSGQTPADAYSSIVYQVGSVTANASAESGATTASLTQLNDQLNSVSGVSIDEESANLITYQNAYEAAARVISTIQALMTATMSMDTPG